MYDKIERTEQDFEIHAKPIPPALSYIVDDYYSNTTF